MVQSLWLYELWKTVTLCQGITMIATIPWCYHWTYWYMPSCSCYRPLRFILKRASCRRQRVTCVHLFCCSPLQTCLISHKPLLSQIRRSWRKTWPLPRSVMFQIKWAAKQRAKKRLLNRVVWHREKSLILFSGSRLYFVSSACVF